MAMISLCFAQLLHRRRHLVRQAEFALSRYNRAVKGDGGSI